MVTVVEKHDLGDIIKPLIKEIHLFDTFVAGLPVMSFDPTSRQVAGLPFDIEDVVMIVLSDISNR